MNRTFTDAEEQQIVILYKAGHSVRALARAYPAGRTAILGAIKRQGAHQCSLKENHELHNRFYSLNHHAFDQIDSEHAAYWLGFLCADGCTYKDKHLSLSLKGEDRQHIQLFLDFIESESKIHVRLVRKKYPVAKTEITSQHLVSQIKRLGVETGRPDPLALTRFVPLELRHHFIRGHWDGDGYVAKNPNDGIGFCGPEELMLWIKNQISLLSNKLDVERHIQAHSKSNIFYLRYSGRLVALAAYNVMFRDATIWLPRKRSIILNWPEAQIRKRDEKGRFI
jgi:hypothetical protein